MGRTACLRSPAMAEMVEFASNGSTARGYLARPAGGSGPGVLVVQEWWGLESSIKEIADQLAAAGFTALCPDLYHGELAEHTEMDKAAQLMTAMPPDRAARDMSGAIDFLLADAGTTGDGVGVVGFCMGGMLSLLIAAEPARRGQGRGPVLRVPVGRQRARLVAAHAPWCAATWPSTTTSSGRRAPTRSRRSCRDSART